MEPELTSRCSNGGGGGKIGEQKGRKRGGGTFYRQRGGQGRAARVWKKGVESVMRGILDCMGRPSLLRDLVLF